MGLGLRTGRSGWNWLEPAAGRVFLRLTPGYLPSPAGWGPGVLSGLRWVQGLRTACGDPDAHSCIRPGVGEYQPLVRSSQRTACGAGGELGRPACGPRARTDLVVSARSLTDPDPSSHSPEGHSCQLTGRWY